MPKYIKAETVGTVLFALEKTECSKNDLENTIALLAYILDTQTVDAVEVVNCKDCMYFKRGWCMNEDIRYGYVNGDDATTFEPDEDFWCKYGERKKRNDRQNGN